MAQQPGCLGCAVSAEQMDMPAARSAAACHQILIRLAWTCAAARGTGAGRHRVHCNPSFFLSSRPVPAVQWRS